MMSAFDQMEPISLLASEACTPEALLAAVADEDDLQAKAKIVFAAAVTQVVHRAGSLINKRSQEILDHCLESSKTLKLDGAWVIFFNPDEGAYDGVTYEGYYNVAPPTAEKMDAVGCIFIAAHKSK